MTSEEKVFSIDDLRLLILSFAIELNKNNKKNNFSCNIKCYNPIEYLLFRIFIYYGFVLRR